MAFTYNLAHSDLQLQRISEVRLELGDTDAASGVRPNGQPLSDAEIAVWLAREGDAVLPAVAAACEALSRQWATAADLQVGSRREQLSQVATRYAERGVALRTQYGGVGGGKGFSTGWSHNDGYARAAEEY